MGHLKSFLGQKGHNDDIPKPYGHMAPFSAHFLDFFLQNHPLREYDRRTADRVCFKNVVTGR